MVNIPINIPQNKNKINILPLNNKNKNKCEYKCIFCSKIPNNPYNCSFCGSYACENCFLEKFSFDDNPKCKICSYGKLEKCKDENKDKINKVPFKKI